MIFILKDDLLKLINTFDLEISHYIENDNFDGNMQYYYIVYVSEKSVSENLGGIKR